MSVEFQVFENDEFYAQVSGPREQAWSEAMNYALQCGGMVTIEEITRVVVYKSGKVVWRDAAPPSDTGGGAHD